MRILFDQGSPVPLRDFLSPHQVETAFERGWSTLTNGKLLTAAERNGFEVFVTTDQNLNNQQNLRKTRLAIVVLSTTSWPRIRKAIAAVQEAVNSALPGSFMKVNIP